MHLRNGMALRYAAAINWESRLSLALWADNRQRRGWRNSLKLWGLFGNGILRFVSLLLVTANIKTLKLRRQSSDLALSSDSVLYGLIGLMKRTKLLCTMRLTSLLFPRLRSRLGSLTSRPGCVTSL